MTESETTGDIRELQPQFSCREKDCGTDNADKISTHIFAPNLYMLQYRFLEIRLGLLSKAFLLIHAFRDNRASLHRLLTKPPTQSNRAKPRLYHGSNSGLALQ